jgi:hypothetical protein
MRPDAPYFIILRCLTPGDFTRQGESAATQWVKGFVAYRIKLRRIADLFPELFFLET